MGFRVRARVRVRVRVRVRWLKASYRRGLLWLQACSTLKPSTLTAWPMSGPRSPCAGVRVRVRVRVRHLVVSSE